MKSSVVFAVVLGGVVLTACGSDSIELVECESYPLKRTERLINSSEFGYLKFRKAATFDALRGDGQFLMADSKFDFSTSYALTVSYQIGSQNIKQHAEGCVTASSLSVKVPLNTEQKNIMTKYGDFLVSNGVHAAEVAKISQALNNSSEYMQQTNFDGYRLLYGLIEHPVRGKFFKIDLRR